MMANTLPQSNTGLAATTQGVFVGEGLSPVPIQLAADIQWGEFVDMGALPPEFWPLAPEDDSHAKSKVTTRQSWSV